MLLVIFVLLVDDVKKKFKARRVFLELISDKAIIYTIRFLMAEDHQLSFVCLLTSQSNLAKYVIYIYQIHLYPNLRKGLSDTS